MQQFTIILEKVNELKYIMLIFFYRVVHTILVNVTDVHNKYIFFHVTFFRCFFMRYNSFPSRPLGKTTRATLYDILLFITYNYFTFQLDVCCR